jgi:hypothetical protein
MPRKNRAICFRKNTALVGFGVAIAEDGFATLKGTAAFPSRSTARRSIYLLVSSWSGVSTAIGLPTRLIEPVGIACGSDFGDRLVGLVRDAFTVVGKQPRQMVVALASLAFSRSHHSVLVKRGSGVSFNGGEAATWCKALWRDAVM